MKNLSLRRLAHLAAGSLLALSTAAHAGVGVNTTVQDGNWSDASTWDNGVPDGADGGTENVMHEVDVVSAGQSGNSVRIGTSAGSALLTISGGELDVRTSMGIGVSGGPGTCSVTAGTLTSASIFVAPDGALVVSGGSVDVDGPDSLTVQGGAIIVEGASGSLATTHPAGDLEVGDLGQITIRPTADGVAGLSAIAIARNVDLQPGSTLVLDTSLYTPSPGDAWEVIRYEGNLTGSFGTLTSTTGESLVQDLSVPGVVTLQVVAPVPSANSTGRALAVLSLALVGAWLLQRREPRRREI